MSKYLMIQNPGIAPLEAFTILGLSSSRNHNETIGAFGSGSKMGCLTLLRKGINPIIFCGLARLEFETEDAIFDSGVGRQNYKKVIGRLSGKVDGRATKRKLDLNWTTDYGAMDWTETGMALREFISNAIDRCVMEFKTYDHRDLRIEIVEECQVRASDGTTRVFVPLNADVEEYYSKLSHKFLQFSPDASPGETMFQNESDVPARIYKKGVLVRELGKQSLYNYNVDNLTLDECRNANDSTCRAEVSRAVRDLPKRKLAELMRRVGEIGDDYLERNLDPYYLRPTSVHWNDGPEREAAKLRWREAFELAFGEDTVLCSADDRMRNLVRRKGKTPITLPGCWDDAATKAGIPTYFTLISEFERKGQSIWDAPLASVFMLDNVWEMIMIANMDGGKEKPFIKSFSEVESNGEAHRLGFVKDNTIYIRSDIADAKSARLYQTVLESCVKYVTGATDDSADHTSFLMQLLTAYCYRPTRGDKEPSESGESK